MTNHTPGDDRSPMVIRTPTDAISAIPYLLGFHPENSLVAVGSGGPNGTCAMRVDLPPLDSGSGSGSGAGPGLGSGSCGVAEAVGERVADMLTRNRFRLALLIGYGPAERVTPLIDATRPALAERDVELREALRVEGGRFWSYLCRDPECCPAEGVPFDITTSAVAAQATLQGQVALPDRTELARTVAPVGGMARRSMRQATDRAEDRLSGWVSEGLDATALRSRMIEQGLPLIREVVDRVNVGETSLTDDQIAWLGVLLTHLRVRDEAWVRIDLDRLDAHVGFWRGVLRRIEEPYVAAPACLLAYAAFSSGNGGLANVALDRAIRSDPHYSMAHLLHELIMAGVPPSAARLGMTPADLAKAYEEHDGPGVDGPGVERKAN